MSIFTKFCTGLMVSALSFSVQAANAPQPPSPQEQPIDAADTTEVLQVLYIGNIAATNNAILVAQKNSDVDLASEYAGEIIQEHYGLNKLVKGLANNRDVSLESDQYSAKVQKIEADTVAAYNALSQVPNDQFRKAYLESTIADHEKALDLFNRVTAQNDDEELKTFMRIFRIMEEKHLAHARELQAVTVPN